MDPFLNNDYTTRKNVTFGEDGYSTEINNPTYVNTTAKEIPIEYYFNQPNLEINNNFYNTTYLSGTSKAHNNEFNNYSYPSSDIINSVKSNNNNDYYNQLLSNEYISNINYISYGNIENTSELNNISNFATVKPLSKKNENINYDNYINNSELLKPSTNANYYSDNTTDFYIGANANNLESIPYLVSSTTNDINNIDLNENYSYTLKVKCFIWEDNSCRFVSFMTLYLFAIRPYFNKNSYINYLKNRELLLELEKAVSVLELDPSNIIRKYYWKYIDDKKNRWCR